MMALQSRYENPSPSRNNNTFQMSHFMYIEINQKINIDVAYYKRRILTNWVNHIVIFVSGC